MHSSVYLEDRYWLPQLLSRISSSLKGVALGSAIGLLDDFDGAALRRLVRLSKSANQARRLLALTEIYDSASLSAGGADWRGWLGDCA
jgi:hypothetical protein